MQLLGTEGFMPRAECGAAMSELLVASMAIGDLVIALCYVTIPLALAGLFKATIQKGRAPQIGAMDVCCLGAFIFSCGATHVCDALMFAWPAYRLTALVLICCAGASLASAVWFTWRAVKEAGGG